MDHAHLTILVRVIEDTRGHVVKLVGLYGAFRTHGAAVCRAGCSSVNGGCSRPNQCDCLAGWIGSTCSTRG